MQHINLPQKMVLDLFGVFHDYFEQKVVVFALFLDINCSFFLFASKLLLVLQPTDPPILTWGKG